MYKYCLILLTAWVFSVAVTAAEPSGFFRVQLENDLGHSDRYYTHGTRIDRLYPSGAAPLWVKSVQTRLGIEPKAGDLSGWYLGQLMFTPPDLSLSDPPKNERPYAGWLFLGAQTYSLSEYRRDIKSVSVGLTGQWSGAEFTQKGVHWLGRKAGSSGFIPPKGWDTQIPTEPTVDVFLERRWKILLTELGTLGAEFFPYVNANLGTVNDVARGGATARLGFNLPDDFGFGLIPFAVPPSSPAALREVVPATKSATKQQKFGVHVFGTLETKFVARSAFLDGTLFRSSRSVEKEPWVHDIFWGVTLSSRRFLLTYSHVTRSREFKGHVQKHPFHSISLTHLR